MIIRSNRISRSDIVAAAVKAGVNFINTNSRDGWFEPIREFTPRRYQSGFEFFLTGSSKYAAAHQDTVHGTQYEKAATWDEWGVVIDALYAVDPAAQIGFYTGRENFRQVTRSERDRVRQGFAPESHYAQTHRAPWLEDPFEPRS